MLDNAVKDMLQFDSSFQIKFLLHSCFYRLKYSTYFKGDSIKVHVKMTILLCSMANADHV